MNPTFPVYAKLKDGSSILLVSDGWQDVELLRWLYWVIADGLSSERLATLRRKEFACFAGDGHEHRGRHAEPFGKLGDLADV